MARLGYAPALLILTALAALSVGAADAASSDAVKEALAIISPSTALAPNSGNITGVVRFVKGVGCSVVAVVRLTGLRPNGMHGFHVHELGNLTGGCSSTGDHWNPTSQTHGAPNGTAAAHAGDLGNIVADGSGSATFNVSNPAMTKLGLLPLYGRALVIHNLTDDLGLGNNSASLSNGQAGFRMACGVIGRTDVAALSAGECPDWTAAGAADGGSAVATITGGVSGDIHFSNGVGCSVAVSGMLSGLRADSSLGFHVHEFGDLSSGCGSTGLHWNPTDNRHGAPNSSASHAGDLGNILVDGSGVATINVSNPVMSSMGLQALYGRTIIVHNLTDDLGLGGNNSSLINGNAGARIACAVIGIASKGSSGVSTNCGSPATTTTSPKMPSAAGRPVSQRVATVLAAALLNVAFCLGSATRRD